MRRRKFILGTGAFAAGSAGAIQTGAFTSVSANRDINVSVAGDGSALLRLGPCTSRQSGNSGYVKNTESGTLKLALSSEWPTDEGGKGVNPDATTVINDVFEICNQGTQPVGVWLDVDPIQNDEGEDAISLYQDSDQSLPIVGEDNAVCLGVGDCVCVGIVTRTQGVEPRTNLLKELENGGEMVVNADADAACSQRYTGSPSRLDTGTADWEVKDLPPRVDTPDNKSLSYDATDITQPNNLYDSHPTAGWIGPFDEDAQNNDDPVDDDNPYVYKLDFTVDAAARDLIIEQFGADNPVDFYLDGRTQSDLIGSSSSSESFRDLESGPTVSVKGGNHTLYAEVINESNGSGGNPTALLVAARLD